MSPLFLAVLVVLLLVAGVAIYRARHRGACKFDDACPPGQVCAGGICRAAGQCASACAPPQVCVGGSCRTPSGACSPACAAPQVCVGGSCLTPASASCYSWTPWAQASKQTPPDIMGFTPGSGGLVPVGAQSAPGQPWALGGASADPNDPAWGVIVGASGSFSPATMYFASSAGPTRHCPSAFAPTADPAKAVSFNGTPVCWDFSGASGAFTPFSGGACTQWAGMGAFSLVADAALAP